MADIRIVTSRQVQPDENMVLHLTGGRPGSAVWQKAKERFRTCLPEIRRLIRPRAAFALGNHGTQRWLYVMLTLGEAVSRQIERLSQQCELDTALFLSAMADSCIFVFEKELEQSLRAFCTEQHCGLSARYEVGTDVPMTVQQEAYELLEARRTLGLTLTAGGMLVPEKSLCFICAVSSDPNDFRIRHDCSQCLQPDCPLRRLTGEKNVKQKQVGKKRYTCPPGQSLLSFLQSQQAALPALCGGKGICGCCRVRVLQGTVTISEADRSFFTAAELADGWRLACQAVPAELVQVEVTEKAKEPIQGLGVPVSARTTALGKLGIAVDLGSTTIAAALVALDGGEVIRSASTANRQRQFGADVVSRIQAACQGRGKDLQVLAVESIQACLENLLDGYSAARERVSRITVAGNTTMEHLLMGWPCQGLGQWPFQPVSLGGSLMQAASVLGNCGFAADCQLLLLPGISTYIGADITAGLLACGLDHTEALTLFLDLGTNGEMAVGNCHRFLTASAAAGPALEGGNIQCGMSSVPGAVCHVDWNQDGLHVETIGHDPARGLCGTGIIETLAMLLECHLADRHGTLAVPYFDRGFCIARSPEGKDICLTQADIRQIQMAKSAIRSGIDILLERYGITAADLQQVYLAGGFGYYLQPEKAAVVGLLPEECIHCTQAAGNTALAGAVQALTEKKARARMRHLKTVAEEIILGNDASFPNLYIKNMDFT